MTDTGTTVEREPPPPPPGGPGERPDWMPEAVERFAAPGEEPPAHEEEPAPPAAPTSQAAPDGTGAAPAAPSPDPRDGEIAELRRRLDELARRPDAAQLIATLVAARSAAAKPAVPPVELPEPDEAVLMDPAKFREYLGEVARLARESVHAEYRPRMEALDRIMPRVLEQIDQPEIDKAYRKAADLLRAKGFTDFEAHADEVREVFKAGGVQGRAFERQPEAVVTVYHVVRGAKGPPAAAPASPPPRTPVTAGPGTHSGSPSQPAPARGTTVSPSMRNLASLLGINPQKIAARQAARRAQA